MPRSRYRWDNVNKELIQLSSDEEPRARVHIISDDLGNYIEHPAAEGRYFCSKSEFRKFTKATGCVELGDQKATSEPSYWDQKREKEARKQALAEAMDRHGYGRH